MSDALIAAIAVILAALLAALLSYMHARHLQRSQARLERLNAQLERALRPSLRDAGSLPYRVQPFPGQASPGSSSLFFDPGSPPASNEELRLFRQWIETVSHPRATRAYELIITRAHLLIEDEMPACLLQFCAHKAGYDVVIQRWEHQDFSEHLSVIRHPGEDLYDYLRQSFTWLKREQIRELATAQGKGFIWTRPLKQSSPAANDHA
jgi:hypothetical protein